MDALCCQRIECGMHLFAAACIFRAGSDRARAISLGVSNGCSKACYSGPTGDCGGELATTVYVVGNNKPVAAPAANKGYTAMGCFQDNIADRAMTLLKTDQGMTVDKCAAMAQKAGGWAMQKLFASCLEAAKCGWVVKCSFAHHYSVPTHPLKAHERTSFNMVLPWSGTCISRPSCVRTCCACCRVHTVWGAMGNIMLWR